ncbi:unnamed protein product [Cylindrotheca closterium]|uniref:Sulfotransferase n=1 Tax=Cylindrotheca closterium TaxID=2856 RepID=A0AAD2CEY6_9STRA|nr:unnamed protein product [Cylindrotheca closterium]
MLRPLEIIFRYVTSSWRVLPDIIVLGEVRCGTTSLCQHLADFELVECHTPFCLWAHPELDNKETFFFVGHYLGIVTPRHYRMCFPLKITKWWSETKRKICGQPSKPFLSFDGCAQYLTSPTAPYLIAQAYREAGEKPPVFIACVRRPAEQALSWWKYENNAMKWGEGMMLNKWNTSLRGKLYPPRSVEDAIDYSRSQHIEDMYQRAESLGIETVENRRFFRLPQWAVTWPGGQLSAIGRTSCFARNILRYERVFSSTRSDKHKQALKHVSIFPIEFLRDKKSLNRFIASILDRAAERRNNKSLFAAGIHLAESSNRLNIIHRNAGSSLSREEEVQYIRSKFAKDEDSLNSLLRVNGIPITYE